MWAAADPLLFVPALALSAVALVPLGLRWVHALRAVGVPPPRPARAIALSARAQAALVLLPGGVGTDVSRISEARFEREALGRVTAAAVGERLAGGLVLAAVTLLLLSLHLRRVPERVSLLSVLALVFLLGVAVRRWSVMARFPFLSVALDGWVLALTLLNQAFALAGLAFALGAGGLRAGALVGLTLAAVSAFTTMLPISINGYGVRELALVGLAPVLGVRPESAVAASLVGSSVVLLWLVAFGLVARLLTSTNASGDRDPSRARDSDAD